MTIDQDILSDIIHRGLVACGSVAPCPECDGEGRIAAYGCGDQAGGYADTCQECKGRGLVDPDEQPGGDPWPEAPCRNCAGAHHVQKCPEILAALRAPYPNGAEIARAFHRNCRGWAREEMQKGFPVVYNDARLYADYMAERLPNQEPMTVLRVIRIWDRAASAHQGERCV